MKKGQVETMGLVIIVILLVIVGLFALIFATRDGGGANEDLFLGMKAGNLANSMVFMSIGSSDFSMKVIDCCRGFDLLACSDVEVSANAGLELLDEKASLIVECNSGEVKEYGDCSTGINSEKIVLSSGDRFFVKICRK